MPEIDPVLLQLKADLADYDRKLGRAVTLADQRLGAIEQRGFQMGQKISKGLSLAATSALAFAASFVTIDLAKRFIGIADEAKNLDAQLRLATKEFGTFAQAQKDVDRIAATTRSGLADTAQLYGNFQRNARELGISQDGAARATESVAKAFKISGAGAVESSQATRQLVQALQSGVLRGDEFNTIMEAGPRLSKLFADSLGVSQGQLRKLAEEGKLTSATLVRALTDKKFTDGLDAEFRELPVTFEQAMTQIDNAAIKVFGAFDRGGQFSKALSEFVIGGSEGFRDMEHAAHEFGINARAAIEGLEGAFAPVFEEAKKFFQFLNDGIGDTTFSLQQELSDFDKLTAAAARVANFIRPFTGIPFPIEGTDAGGRYQRREQAAQARLRRGEQNFAGRYLDRFGTPGQTGGAARPTTAGPSKSDQRSAEAAARKAEQERLRAIREDAANARDSARLDDDILAAKAALAVAAEDLNRFALEAIESERKQRNADLETDVKLGNLSREEADRRILINNELAGLQKQLAERRKDEAIVAREMARVRDAADTQRAEAELIDAREKRRDAELRILDLAYAEEEAAIRRAAANGEIADLDEALANMRRRRAAGEASINRQNESPGAKYLRDLGNEATNLGDAYEDIAVRGLERMNDALNDSIKSALGLHGALGDIIGDFIELALRQQILGPLANAIFGGASLFGGAKIGGNTAGLEANFDNVFKVNGKRAAGGPVSAGGTYLVGERGPELLRMGGSSGNIIPNHQLARGGGGVQQNITIKVDAQGTVLTSQVQAWVAAGVQQATAMGSQIGAGQAEATLRRRARNTLR